jgi:hypothetical protein
MYIAMSCIILFKVTRERDYIWDLLVFIYLLSAALYIGTFQNMYTAMTSPGWIRTHLSKLDAMTTAPCCRDHLDAIGMYICMYLLEHF